MNFRLLTFYLMVFWLPTSLIVAQPNDTVVTTPRGSPYHLTGEIGSKWEDVKIAELRIRAALEHQNQLRQAANIKISNLRGKQVELPKLELRFKIDDNRYAAPLKTNKQGAIRFWIEQGFPEMGSSGDFHIDGDLLIKSDYNDAWSLNYVYRFDGPNLVEIIPFSIWKLQQYEGGEVLLYREMSSNELTLWKNGHFDKLGSDKWGFGEGEGKVQSVLHFSVKPWNGKARVKISVKKASLLDACSEKPVLVWAGALDTTINSFKNIENFEIVLGATLLRKLITQGDIKIEFLP